MKRKLFAIGLCIASIPAAQAQQKIKDGTLAGSSSLPNANAILELESNNKGIMLSRVALTDTSLAAPLSAHVKGMVVYDTATNAATGITPGIYYNDGTKWVRANSGTAPLTAWQLTGNAGTTPPSAVGAATAGGNYWGTSDAKNLAVATNGITRMIFDTAGNVYGGTHGSYVPTVTANGGNNRNFVWGRNNIVSDPAALGNSNSNAIFGANNKVIGGGILYGSTNVVGGGSNTVAASASAVFGDNNTDSALYTIMGGHYNIITASAANSIMAGGEVAAADGNYLSGGSSAVFGKSNKDSAYYTLVAGQGNIIGSTGTGAVALGYGNTVKGAQAAAFGQGTIAASNVELATGRYNRFTTGNATSWDATDAMVQVGVGTSDASRANAVTVLKSGYTAIGIHAAKPASTLQVNGSFAPALKIVTANYTLTADDYTIVCDFTGLTPLALTLPDPAGCSNRIYKIISYNDAGATFSRDIKTVGGTMPSGTATIKGGQVIGAPSTIAGGVPTGNSVTIQSNGISWYLVGL